MGTRTNRLKDPPDRPVPDELPGEDSAFRMQPLAVVDHVFLSGPRCGCPGLFQLVKGRKRRFIGEVIFAAFHHATSESAPFTWDGRRREEFDREVIEDFLKIRSRLHARKLLAERFNFRFIRVVNPLEISLRLLPSHYIVRRYARDRGVPPRKGNCPAGIAGPGLPSGA